MFSRSEGVETLWNSYCDRIGSQKIPFYFFRSRSPIRAQTNSKSGLFLFAIKDVGSTADFFKYSFTLERLRKFAEKGSN